jgi:hypothetical protein
VGIDRRSNGQGGFGSLSANNWPVKDRIMAAKRCYSPAALCGAKTARINQLLWTGPARSERKKGKSRRFDDQFGQMRDTPPY